MIQRIMFSMNYLSILLPILELALTVDTVEVVAHKWGITDLLPSDHLYKNAAHNSNSATLFGNDEGEKLNVNPEGAPDGPLANRFSAVNNNYGS